MAETEVMGLERGTAVESRTLGRVDGSEPGAVLLCVAGIHGNEPAGVHAVRRVLSALGPRRSAMRGSFVALAGNVGALERGRRFVDRDLNRAWTAERVTELRRGIVDPGIEEDREQAELLEAIEEVLRATDGPIYALDLHTTSGPGGVFSAFTDALPHRTFASAFPVPMIFGLEELVDGTLLNLLSENGVVALTVETGQHEEPAAIDRAEATVWIGVVEAGLLPERLVPEATEARKLLQRDVGRLPRALEMRYKHDIDVGDGFVMNPGYANFDPVRGGEVVARDVEGEIAAAETGRLLMPLYQEQGEDGFFLVREFSPFWMGVSFVMRRAGLGRAAHWLPGVRRIDDSDDVVVIDRKVARHFARQLFHLLGYRKLEDDGPRLVMRRRRFDERRYVWRPPSPDSIDVSPARPPTPGSSTGQG